MDKLNTYQMYFDNLSKNTHRMTNRNKDLKKELLFYRQNEDILRRKVGLELELHKTVVNCLRCKFYLNKEYKADFINRLKEINDNVYHTKTKAVYRIIYTELKKKETLFFSEKNYIELFGFKGRLPDERGPMPSVVNQPEQMPSCSHQSTKTISNNSINQSFVRFMKKEKKKKNLTKKEEQVVKQYFLNTNIIELFFEDLSDSSETYLKEFKDFYSRCAIETEINFQTYAFLKKLSDLKNQHLVHLNIQLTQRKNAVDENEIELNGIMENSVNVFLVELQEKLNKKTSSNIKCLHIVRRNAFIIDKVFEMSKIIVTRDNIDKHLGLIRIITKDKKSNIRTKKIEDVKTIDVPIKQRSKIWATLKTWLRNEDEKLSSIDAKVLNWFSLKMGFKIGFFNRDKDFLNLIKKNEFDYQGYFDFIFDLLHRRFEHNMTIYKEKVLQIIIFVNKVNVFTLDPFAGKDSRFYVNNAKLNVKKLIIKSKLVKNQKAALKLGKIKNMFLTKKKETKENNDIEEGEDKDNKLTHFLKNNRQDNIYIKNNLLSILSNGKANKSFSIRRGRAKIRRSMKKKMNKTMQFYEIINENYKVLNKLKDGWFKSSEKDYGYAQSQTHKRILQDQHNKEKEQ